MITKKEIKETMVNNYYRLNLFISFFFTILLLSIILLFIFDDYLSNMEFSCFVYFLILFLPLFATIHAICLIKYLKYFKEIDSYKYYQVKLGSPKKFIFNYYFTLCIEEDGKKIYVNTPVMWKGTISILQRYCVDSYTNAIVKIAYNHKTNKVLLFPIDEKYYED